MNIIFLVQVFASELPSSCATGVGRWSAEVKELDVYCTYCQGKAQVRVAHTGLTPVPVWVRVRVTLLLPANPPTR